MNMKRILASLLVLVLLFTSAEFAQAAPNTQELYEAAGHFMQEGKYAEAAEKYAQAGDYEDASQMSMYCYAVDAAEKGLYSLAVVSLQALGTFRDAALLTKYYAARAYEDAEDYENAQSQYVEILFFRDVNSRLALLPEKINARDYAKADASERAGRLEDALRQFKALGSYRDSAERAEAVQRKIDELKAQAEEAERAAAYEKADQAEKAGSYGEAYEGFLALGSYRDSAERAEAIREPGQYAQAMRWALGGDFLKAQPIFSSLGEYRDSAEKAYILSALSLADKLEDRGNGVAVFRYRNCWGVLNINTNSLISPYWDSIGEFNSLGLAKAGKDQAFGYIDRNGQVILPAVWYDVSAFSGSLCTVTVKAGNRYLFGLYDKDGREIAAPEWRSLGYSVNSAWNKTTNQSTVKAPSFDRAVIRVQAANGLWGLMNDRGETLGEIRWDSIGTFNGGDIALAGSDGLYGVIDRNGGVVLPAEYDEIEGMKPDLLLIRQKGKYGLASVKGEIVLSPRYDAIDAFSENLAAVRLSGKYGFIDLQGGEVIAPQYDAVRSFHEGLAAVRMGEKWQYINPVGQTVIPPLYSQALDFGTGKAAVYLPDAGWQMIDKTGALLLFVDGHYAVAYQTATELMEAGEYEQAEKLFLTLAGYKDAVALSRRCEEAYKEPQYQAALALMEQEKYQEAGDGFKAVAGYRDASALAERCDSLYRAAQAEAAAEAQRASAYAKAENAEKAGRLDEAYKGFLALGSYRDSAERAESIRKPALYERGLVYADKGEFKKAYDTFAGLGEYEDSAQKAYVLSVVTFADKVEDRGNGVAVFRYRDNWGILNVRENAVTSPYWDEIGKLNGFRLAEVNKDKKYGYINALGESVIACEWDRVSAFGGRLCAVARVEKEGVVFGLYDAEGHEVTPPVWRTLGKSVNSSWNGKNNQASVYQPSFQQGVMKVQARDGKWGLIDQQGAQVLEPVWDEIEDFNGSTTAFAVKNGKCGAVSVDGTVVLEPIYDSLDYIEPNLILTSQNYKDGLMSRGWETILEPQFDEIQPFANGLAVVRNGSKYGLIDVNGKVLVTPKYDEIRAFEGSVAVVANNRHYGLINTAGEELLAPVYDEIKPFKNGLAVVRTQKKYGLIDERGNVLVNLAYDAIDAFDGDAAVVTLNGKKGFINRKGGEIVPPQYEEVRLFREGMAALKKQGYWLYANAEGKIVIEGPYLQALDFKDGQADVYLQDMGWQIVDKSGSLLYFVDGRFERIYLTAEGMMNAGEYLNARALFLTLTGYKDAAALAKQCEDLQKGPDYEAALALMQGEKYAEARDAFIALPGYKDADKLATRCEELRIEAANQAIYESALALMQEGKYLAAFNQFRAIKNYRDANDLATQCDKLRVEAANQATYEAALALMQEGKYAEARNKFRSIKNYRDADDLATQCEKMRIEAANQATYETALALMQEGKYAEARTKFLSIRFYKDAYELAEQCEALRFEAESKPIYQNAVNLKKQKKYAAARKLFLSISAYKNSAELARQCLQLQNRINIKKKGATVIFGHYEQDSVTSNGKEEIEWIVLDVQKGKSLLISKYALDCRPYHAKYVNITWEKCNLRAWLNKSFLNAAFGGAEKKAIIATKIINDTKKQGPYWGSNGGNDTKDKVFLLSYAETGKYFSTNQARTCQPTEYAIMQGSAMKNGKCCWWLRSSGFYQNRAVDIGYEGARDYSNPANDNFISVRPAMWVNQKSF